MRRTLPLWLFAVIFFMAALLVGASDRMITADAAGRARPSPTPDGLGPAPGSPSSNVPQIPPMPDLIVEQVEIQPSNPTIGEQVLIQVYIKNQGDGDVPLNPPQNFWTDLYIDPDVVPIRLFQEGQYSWGCQAYWFPAGGEYILTAYHTFTEVKDFILYVQVDTDGQVPESDENNNVLGPIHVSVNAPDKWVQETHQDFQMGMASNMDISHPDGVLRLGIFWEPHTEPEVYYPDVQVDNPPSPPSHPNNVNQIKPDLTGDGNQRLFAVWEDGRNGGVLNRDIYFSRSDDGGQTWTDDIRVNDDSGSVNQLDPAIAYDRTRNRIYVVWQDGRNTDYDIYFAYSDDYGDTWSTNERISFDPPNSPTADQMNPSIAVGPSGSVYVVWQDQRNGNDDIYLARADYVGGNLVWVDGDNDGTPDNYFVTDDPDMRWQNQVAPSIAVQRSRTGSDRVYVVWEDWRAPEHPEIYVSVSCDQGRTFGIDVPVVEPAGQSYRVEPTIAVGLFEGGTITEPIFIHDIHVAWQEGQGDEADVYWTYAEVDFIKLNPCSWPYELYFEAPQQINGFVLDSDYVLPPDAASAWPIEPSWQGQPSLVLATETDSTMCHADSTEAYTRGVFIAWSDARTFDDWRYEIHIRRIASPGGHGGYEPCEDSHTGVLNDNAKLDSYRDDPDLYTDFKPAATGQFHPQIYRADNGRIYVIWDDDRWNDPMGVGVRDRDVFIAWTGIVTEAVYISPVFDSGASDTTWYVLSWWAATEHGDELFLQTRFGNNPDPPQEDIAANGWTRWTGNPSDHHLNCTAGAGCYYDAPGRHIVDENGNDWLTGMGTYRYIQYKVIIRRVNSRCYCPFKTALSRVTIYYDGPDRLFLPIVLRNR